MEPVPDTTPSGMFARRNALVLSGALLAGTITAIEFFVVHGQGHGVTQILVSRLTLLSSFAWVFTSTTVCLSLLLLFQKRNWLDIFIFPLICWLCSNGIARVFRAIVGPAGQYVFYDNADFFASRVLVKLDDALVGWCFLMPLWLFAVGNKPKIVPIILCSIVSILYLSYFFVLP